MKYLGLLRQQTGYYSFALLPKKSATAKLPFKQEKKEKLSLVQEDLQMPKIVARPNDKGKWLGKNKIKIQLSEMVAPYILFFFHNFITSIFFL